MKMAVQAAVGLPPGLCGAQSVRQGDVGATMPDTVKTAARKSVTAGLPFPKRRGTPAAFARDGIGPTVNDVTLRPDGTLRPV